jgi:cell division septation protein DedD
MEKLDKHISELLNEHDCVIVPEFGGFVANYAPAKIHPVQHTFTPPSKKIVFNKNLKNNDGLLANHVVMAERTTYPQALKYISHFVDNTSAVLKKGGKVKIEEVGTLFLDVERNIQFEPDANTNHLLDAFGLSAFQSPAIKRDNISKRIEKEFKDRDAIPAERKKINIKKYVALAIAMPLLFGMIWVPLKTDLLKNINYSDLNPFSSKEVVKPETKKAPDTVPVKVVIPKDTVAQQAEVENTDPQPVTEALVEPVVKADTTRVAVEVNVDPSNKFHLVAGCFAIEENAIKFVASLQQQNLNASIIGKNNKGLFVVSCGDYATRKEANDELSNLRKLQPNAWLYKN